MLVLSSANFIFKSNIFENYLREYHLCQEVWSLIRPNVLSDLNWVKTICKDFQQSAVNEMLNEVGNAVSKFQLKTSLVVTGIFS